MLRTETAEFPSQRPPQKYSFRMQVVYIQNKAPPENLQSFGWGKPLRQRVIVRILVLFLVCKLFTHGTQKRVNNNFFKPPPRKRQRKTNRHNKAKTDA